MKNLKEKKKKKYHLRCLFGKKRVLEPPAVTQKFTELSALAKDETDSFDKEMDTNTL